MFKDNNRKRQIDIPWGIKFLEQLYNIINIKCFFSFPKLVFKRFSYIEVFLLHTKEVIYIFKQKMFKINTI